MLVQGDVRIRVGEAMELLLIHGSQDLLVDGRESHTFPGEDAIEILRIQGVFLEGNIKEIKYI